MFDCVVNADKWRLPCTVKIVDVITYNAGLKQCNLSWSSGLWLNLKKKSWRGGLFFLWCFLYSGFTALCSLRGYEDTAHLPIYISNNEEVWSSRIRNDRFQLTPIFPFMPIRDRLQQKKPSKTWRFTEPFFAWNMHVESFFSLSPWQLPTPLAWIVRFKPIRSFGCGAEQRINPPIKVYRWVLLCQSSAQIEVFKERQWLSFVMMDCTDQTMYCFFFCGLQMC